MLLVRSDILSISLLLFSFINLYTYNKVICFIVISISFIFHSINYIIYEYYFESLRKQFMIEKENVLSFALKFSNKRETIQNECNICFDEITFDDDEVSLKCNCKDKFYHDDCVLEWFSKGKTICPFCRHEFDFPSILSSTFVSN